MSVRIIRYERLFSLERYNNERIGFEVAVAENEDPDVAIGGLFFKIARIEEVFQEYRGCMERHDQLDRMIKETMESIGWHERELAQKKATIDELRRSREVDDRYRAACEARSLKRIQQDLEEARRRLEKHESEKREVETKIAELKARIKNGDFSEKEDQHHG